jgi:hypothetical protein
MTLYIIRKHISHTHTHTHTAQYTVIYVMYQCTDITVALHLHRCEVPIQKTTAFHFMEFFKDRHLSRIYLVMCCLYLMYFLEDKTVLISLENTEICLPHKFALKYECLKVHKMWYMYFVLAG